MMKYLGSHLVVVMVLTPSALAFNAAYKTVREDVEVPEEYVLQVLQWASNTRCAMAASVKGAAAFASRVLEEGQVECSLLGPGLPDPASLPNSTTPGQTYRLWIVEGWTGGNEGESTTFTSTADTTTTTGITTTTDTTTTTGPTSTNDPTPCTTSLEGVYYLHPTVCAKYLRCASLQIQEMECGSGTVFKLSQSICVFPGNLDGEQCASDGSAP